MAFIFACSLCVTNSSCNDKKMDGADSLASDSTLVDTTAADSTDEIIAETPMPKAADELFDDFIFNFAANKKLQMKRICFPLPVYKNGKLTKEIEKGKWIEAIFAKAKPAALKASDGYDDDDFGHRGDDEQDEDMDIIDDNYNKDDDDDIPDDDELTEESYRTTIDENPEDLDITVDDLDDDEY